MTETTPTRRRPTRAQKREANRERILTAARTVFGARGYHSATIEEIADEAALSNGAIYYNFQNKEELFLALLDERLEERLEHTRRTIGAGSGSSIGEHSLEEEARDVSRSFRESREWRLLLLEFATYAARNPAFAAPFRDHTRRLRAALAEIVELYLRSNGIAPSMPVEQLALAISGLANGLALEELADPGSVSEDLLGDVLAVFVSGSASAHCH